MLQLAEKIQAKSSVVSRLRPRRRAVAKVTRMIDEEIWVSLIQQPLNSLVYAEVPDETGRIRREYFLIIEHSADHSKLYPLSYTPMLRPSQRVYADADWDKIYVGPYLLGRTISAFGRDQGGAVRYSPTQGWIDKKSIISRAAMQPPSSSDEFLSKPENAEDAVNIRFGSWLRFDQLDFLMPDYALAASNHFDVVVVASDLKYSALLYRDVDDQYLRAKLANHVHIRPHPNAKDLEHRLAKMTAVAVAQGFARRGLDVSLIIDKGLRGDSGTLTVGNRQYISPFREFQASEYCGYYMEGSVTGFLDADISSIGNV